MEDLQQTLRNILSDPDQMAQLQAMAGALGLTGQAPASPPQAEEAAQAGARAHGPSPLPEELSARLPELLGRLGSLHGPEEQVLTALRPTLAPEKQGRIDKALQAARISRLAGQFLRKKEGPDV